MKSGHNSAGHDRHIVAPLVEHGLRSVCMGRLWRSDPIEYYGSKIEKLFLKMKNTKGLLFMMERVFGMIRKSRQERIVFL